jgi:glycine/D-amino acid oxidase-like deaminating enzyme
MKKENFKEKSFWLTTRDYVPGDPLRENIEVDVAIVGGGFTGLSSAYHLKKAEPNMRIALIESQVIGFGASGRNGGFNMTLFGLKLALTAMRFSKSRAREAHHYMEKAVDTLRNLVGELNLDCDYEHSGFLRVATSEKYKRRILKEIELVNSLDIHGISWMDKEQTQKHIRSPMYLGAWWEPRCGILNPAKLAWSWKETIEPMGVQIYENTPVIEIAQEKGRLSLNTPNARLSTDKIVLATNAWSHFFKQFKRKQIPLWTYIVLTEPLNEEHFKEIGWQNRQGIEDARNLVHYYRLTADNRLLMGGRDVRVSFGKKMDIDLNPGIFSALKKDVVELFPVLKDIRFTHEWGGPVSVTADIAPSLGYAKNKRIVYSVGCAGHGVSLSHLNGCTIADLILERKTELTDVFFVNRKTPPCLPGPIHNLTVEAFLRYMRWEDHRFDQ